MLFNSWQYVVFLPLVMLLYWLLPHRFRWVLLLGASYYFYMRWNAGLIVLIVTTTLTSYVAARGVAAAVTPRVKRLWLWFGCGSSLALLFFFKYFNFFAYNVTAALRGIGLAVNDVALSVLLPVGISFYTFQTLSYVIDVYRGVLAPEKHLGLYALYVSFFPQLVAGPIERAVNLLPQMHEKHTPDPAAWSWGLRMICFGLFKKIALADFLAPCVSVVYGAAERQTPMAYLLATVLFAVQIYCDFSGYSDIALGSARLLGFRLSDNFNTPYLARTISDFWARWHISLSSWLRDYVYTPLTGWPCTTQKACAALLLTFFASGLWHGAAWHFVLWGVLHGLYQVVGSLTKTHRRKLRKRLGIDANAVWYRAWQTLFVFALVCASYVLFRADTLAQAAMIFTRLPLAVIHPIANLRGVLPLMGLTGIQLPRLLLSLSVLVAYDAVRFHRGDPFVWLAQCKAPVRIAISYGLALCVLLAALTQPENSTVEFIYFQF